MSAVTAMWAWHNSVSPAADDRGLGFAPAAPDRIAAFAAAGELREVFLAAPREPVSGPVGAWFAESCAALHARGLEVGALGADAAWLRDPAPFTSWLAGVRAFADVDRLHLAVEPWATPAWANDRAAAMRAYLALLEAAAAGPNALPIDADVPAWFALEPSDEPTSSGSPDLGDVPVSTSPGASLLDAVLTRTDHVSILAFADSAHAPGGILALADAAIRACARADRPFTIGVQTAAPGPNESGSASFFHRGPVALLQEAAAVGAALAGVPGYRGVAVAHHRAWRGLLGV